MFARLPRVIVIAVLILLVAVIIIATIRGLSGNAPMSQAEQELANRPVYQQAADKNECNGIGWNKQVENTLFWCNDSGANNGEKMFFPQYEGTWLIYTAPIGTNAWEVQ